MEVKFERYLPVTQNEKKKLREANPRVETALQIMDDLQKQQEKCIQVDLDSISNMEEVNTYLQNNIFSWFHEFKSHGERRLLGRHLVDTG